jgi:hypothetical protein
VEKNSTRLNRVWQQWVRWSASRASSLTSARP